MTFGLTQTIAVLIGPALPLVTGWIARQDTTGGVKAVTLLGLSAVVSFGSALIAAVSGGAGFDWLSTLLAVLGTFVAGVATHFGLWKQIGVANVVGALPGFIGSIAKEATVVPATKDNGGPTSA